MKIFPGYTLILKSLMFGLLLGTVGSVLGADPAVQEGTNSPPETGAVAPTDAPNTTAAASPASDTNSAPSVQDQINPQQPAISTIDPAIAEAIAAAEAAATSAKVEVAKAAQAQFEQNERLIRANLMLQEQLHEAVGAIQRTRDESSMAITQNANAVAKRLELIESALAQGRDREIEATQSSNKLVLIVSVVFASVGLLALVVASWFQLRAMNRFAELSANRFAPQALPPHHTDHLEGTWPEDHDNFHEPGYSNRLGSVIQSLESRVRELEHTPQVPLPSGTKNGIHNLATDSDEPATVDPSDPVSVLIGKGQSLLNANEPSKALTAFEEALEIDPKSTEAWIKKGTALERLNRLEEALQSYDQAIVADETLTLAYLYKGGVFNQLERFNEALECYEQALRSQDRAEAETAGS